MGLSVDGLSSGLDTTDIISKLIEIEKRPIRKKEQSQVLFKSKLDAWSDLTTRLSSLRTVVDSMNTSTKLSGLGASFFDTNTSAARSALSATTASTATSGTFTVVVDSIARAEKEVSQGFSSTSGSLGTGTVVVTVGGIPTSIEIDSSSNTLEGIKKAINNAKIGVTASILNDGSSSPYRLVVTGNNTGTSNALTISDTLSGGAAVFSFSETQSAADSQFTIDGIEITKETNTVTDVIEGTTLSLTAAGSGTLTLSSDTSDIKEQISDFVDAYNEIMTFVDEQFEYDAANKLKGGVLFGNGTLQTIQGKLRGIVSAMVPSLTGTYAALSQIGIRTERDGQLSIDDSELSDALREDASAVIDLFAVSDSSTDSRVSYLTKTNNTKAGTYEIQVSGGIVRMREEGETVWNDMTGSGRFWSAAAGDANGLQIEIDSLSDGSYGSVTVATGVADRLSTEIIFLTDKSYQGLIFAEEDNARKNIVDLQDQIEDMEFRINEKETRLKAEFATLEVLLARLQGQQNYLTQMFASMTKS